MRALDAKLGDEVAQVSSLSLKSHVLDAAVIGGESSTSRIGRTVTVVGSVSAGFGRIAFRLYRTPDRDAGGRSFIRRWTPSGAHSRGVWISSPAGTASRNSLATTRTTAARDVCQHSGVYASSSATTAARLSGARPSAAGG